MLEAMLLLLGCQLLGEALVRLLGLPIPGAVAGMGLLLMLLVLRGRVSPALRQLAAGLLGVLTLLFVPAAVGVIEHGELLRQQGAKLLLVLVVSTVVAMAATGLCLQRLLAADRGRSSQEQT